MKIVKQRWESYLDIAWCCTLALVLQTPHTVFLHVLAWGYHIFALLFVVQIHMFWYKGPSPSRDSSLRELGNKKGKITSRWEAWICWNCSPRLLLNQYVWSNLISFTSTNFILAWFDLPSQADTILPTKRWGRIGTRTFPFLCSSATSLWTGCPFLPLTPLTMHC